MKEKRNKTWIDRFQTKLCLRIACYFALYQIAVWALVVIERHLSTSMGGVFSNAGPGLAVLLAAPVVLLGVLFIYDAVKFSHRFVGPLYRFRKTIQAVTAGEELDLMTLRQADFLQEMKDDFNKMLKALEERGSVSLKGCAAKYSEQQAVGK